MSVFASASASGHTLSADDMVVDLSQAKVDALLLMAEFHGANLCVLAHSPAVPLFADQSSKKAA